MSGNKINVIGLMSGTSLDGLDIVYVCFDIDSAISFKIIYSETIPYSNDWKCRLQDGIHKSKEELKLLDVEYGVYLGNQVNVFIKKNNISDIHFIASHGHTILHQPEKGITLQVGDGKEISVITNHTVVCDFRTQDVKLGGQGAPLVPIGDASLFSNYDACLNLGGFANVSFDVDDERIAFDICPVNIVLNHYVAKVGFGYDDKGRNAATGKVNATLLKQLNALSFYSKNYPKSLGLEWVQAMIFPIIDAFPLSIKDVLRTFVEHIAMQIGDVTKECESILVTGGGVFNTFLIERIKHYAIAEILLPNNEVVNYKEALIFAYLGLLKMENKVNCLKSVTGAIRDHSSGVIFIPKK